MTPQERIDFVTAIVKSAPPGVKVRVIVTDQSTVVILD